MSFDVEKIRADFPALSLTVHGKPLVFLDSAASAQKPLCVLDALYRQYQTEYANVHRGMYELSEKATLNFEQARKKVQNFIHAASDKEIVFTRGATDSINLVAYTWGAANLTADDEIILSQAEHHSNIVSWQILQQRIGFKIKVVPVDDNGDFVFEEYLKLLSDKTKLVAVAHVSNVLGTVFPVKDIVEAAHKAGAVVLLDGCQAATHLLLNMQDLDCDFYAFSGHKLYGPTGIGVLYGKKALLENMPPFEGGGDMIKTVSFEKSVWAEPPARFEAGTPPIMQAIGLGHAIDYVRNIGMENIDAYEHDLCLYLQEQVASVGGTRILGTSAHKTAVVSFVTDFAHPQDIAMVLDQEGVAVRTGHHCAQPLHERFGVSVSVRASLGLYNTKEDIEKFIAALHKAKRFFS
ncbi:MAG: cysteine desulfurase [Alphaproteobacteria bacterium]|nr:cysteine desulfurase [Alphaproteobacteria bacterium]